MISNNSSQPPLAVLSDIFYRYPSLMEEAGELALRGVSLTIGAGEFVAVLGANGSGKSTLAKHLNALLLPEQGQVTVCGLDTAEQQNHWAIRQQVGMVFQNPDNQIVATVVEEDIAFGPENLGLSMEEIQRRVAESLGMVGMEEYRKHAPHLLSGGQKQRVAIAGVIAMRPRLIVFDEATAMLDPVGRSEVIDCMLKLHEEGIGIVLITHHMREALLADRVVLMAEGKIVAAGAPREIFTQVELLHQLHLDAPPMAEIAWKLFQDGLLPHNNILSLSEMVDELCRLS